MEERIKTILAKYDIDISNSDNNSTKLCNLKQIYDTAWQVGDTYILKVYDDLTMLERNIRIITVLDSMNIPVGSIIPTVENKTYVQDEEYHYILTERLQGKYIESIKGNMGLACEMGRIIAKLHLAFKECECQNEFWNNSLLAEMKGWIKDTLENDGWKYISERQYDDIVSKLELLYDKLPVQLIHRDVHFGNFLFDEGKFSGYIDFDLSQRNIRIFDLCYFMLGLLSEEEQLEVTEDEWFDILKQVFLGYEKLIQLSAEEKQAVPYVMMCIELLFVAWFVGQNDIGCAEDAVRIYNFVEKNVMKIMQGISNKEN